MLAASASCLERSPVTLQWACVSVRGAYQKLPLIGLLRWFHFAVRSKACCCLLGKRGTGDGERTIHLLLCQLYSTSITVICSCLSPSWAAKILSFTCKKIITLQLPLAHWICPCPQFHVMTTMSSPEHDGSDGTPTLASFHPNMRGLQVEMTMSSCTTLSSAHFLAKFLSVLCLAWLFEEFSVQTVKSCQPNNR